MQLLLLAPVRSSQVIFMLQSVESSVGLLRALVWVAPWLVETRVTTSPPPALCAPIPQLWVAMVRSSRMVLPQDIILLI